LSSRSINTSLGRGGGTTTSNFNVDSFDLEGIFGLLAKEDIYRAVELARGFTADAPRAVATLAIARSVLEKKSSAMNEESKN
jgi:hypothetical protein